MTLRETLRRAIESRSEIEASDERAAARQTSGCVAVDEVRDRCPASVSGVLRSVTLRPREGVQALEAELFDGSGTLDLVWLGRRAIAGITPGRRLRADGFVCAIAGRRTIFNPRYELRSRPGE